MPAEYLKTLALHRALMRAELHGRGGGASDYDALLRYLQSRVSMLECLPADEGAGIVHEAIAQDITHTGHALMLVRHFISDICADGVGVGGGA